VSNPLLLVGADNPGQGLAVAFLNLFVALALVSVALALGFAVSLLALLCDRAREAQPIRLKAARRVAR
jgi:hypothetical protein